MEIDTSRLRTNLPQVGYPPYRQVHAHSTGNPNSTAQNEADYHMRRPVDSGFFSHVVGNGRVMQTWYTNKGAYDVGGGWNYEGYGQVELIESHSTKEEFMIDYRLYVELLRNLADEAGIPKTLDSGSLAGIKTHEYCTYHQPYNASDHVDPYPYLEKWGISREQFKYDVENGLEKKEYKEGWKQNSSGWWYQNKDGSYPQNDWKKINNEWFYFDEQGYCLINQWLEKYGKWYWLDDRGAMATGWKNIWGRKFYFNEAGVMQTGWVKYKDHWFYCDPSNGDMKVDQYIKHGNGWYYLKPNGEMASKEAFNIEPDGLITVK